MNEPSHEPRKQSSVWLILVIPGGLLLLIGLIFWLLILLGYLLDPLPEQEWMNLIGPVLVCPGPLVVIGGLLTALGVWVKGK